MRSFIAASMGLLSAVGIALAAGPFDGTWHGTVEGSSGRCPQGAVAMQITDTEIVGRFSIGGAQVPFRGTVTPDGAVTVAYDYPAHGASGKMTGKISGSDFTGSFNSLYQTTSSSCSRNVAAKRD
ncbi:MAG TPA: hypothetical protein VGR79_13380 [Stellaceae bacterium]|nr:hypothetical protein [Stellaceae bacterium]